MVNREITKIEGDMSIKPSSDPTIYGEGNLDIAGDLNVLGNVSFGSSTILHSALANLSADDHAQYALLSGRTGGQVIIGGTSASNNTTIRSTSNATKGSVIFDETTATTSNSTGAVRLDGGLGISNTTDAISSTNGGTITTAGGLAVAKKAFIGTDLSVGGNLTVTGSAAFPHSGFTGLGADDHTQYTLNLGRTGGQVITGGTAASNNTTIRSTSNATKGSVIFDETTTTTSSSTGALRVAGGIGISNTTDATSATNGGTITTAGGLAVAKKAFVGTDLVVGGNLTVTGTAALPHSGFTGLAADDHTQYALLAGRTGGQIITGGSGASNNTTIRSTSNATKGSVIFDEVTATNSSVSGAVRLAGGIGISNTTDATSATNGGTITTAGGLAVAKKAFVGTDLAVGGNLTVTGTAALPHSGFTGLTADDHTQYALLAGRTGGQIIIGGTGASNNTTIRSTSNATKGSVIFDEVTATNSSVSGAVRLAGGIGISNTADASSATNGGTITTAGGLAVAKKAFVGTDLSVGGNLTVTGTAALPHSGFTGLLADDHTIYTLNLGRTGGQVITGGTASGNNTTLRSTSSATKGSVIFDETTATTSNTSGSILVSGGIGISNTTDALSVSNGGTITTAGGLSVAKRVFVGTDLSVGGNLTVIGTAALPHSGFTGLLSDDHTIYALLVGRTGGQVITGGIASGNDITIRSTSSATKGSVIFDETTATSSSVSGSILVSGGLGISNITDAVSATNGGTITTAGGLAVAKKAFVGTDLSVGGNSSLLGNLTVSGALSFGSATISHSGLINLTADDHTQYTLNLGRAGGQVITGGTASGNNTTIRSTSNATKGSVIFDETTPTISSSTGALRISGGLGISNTTDAVSATNGGTITTAGGLAVAKNAFVGANLNVGGNSSVLGNLTVSGALSFGTATISHSTLTNLSADDHSQYTLNLGRTGGQVITGGTAASNNTTIRSTSNATKGSVIFDEGTATTSSSTGALLVSGGIGISNTTDATSATNGGTITTAGGLSVAKKAFVGTDLAVGGNLTVTGTASLPHSGFTGLLADDHTIYTLNLGRAGGQVITGGTASGNNTTIRSTSNATKGSVIFDETTTTTSSSTGAVRIAGGIGISNTTDATSATNGGTITTAGGLAVAKKAFVGTDLSVGGNLTVTGTASLPHSGLTGLLADDHTQYALLAGRTGGQVITGGTASGNNTTIRSTSNAAKGSVIFDETAATSSSSTGAVLVSGGIGISNTTDATSATNGGTITTAGGLAVAKKAFVGTDLSVGGNLTVTGTASLPHSGLTGLLADDHTQYALLAGRTGGQVITGGTASGNNTTIRSTSNATKGSVIFDETAATSSSSTGAVLVSGGIGISNTTDATSATNGGTITTAGGLAVAKKAFVGTDLSVGGNLTVTGTASLPHSGLTGLLADDHTQYALLAGRTGGQVITGGTASGNNTTIRSTSNATKGSVIFDEGTATTSSSSGAVLVSGGIGISNTTDAISVTNGGTITTAGGLAVAKKAFVGTDLSVGGNLTVTGTASLPHSGLTGLLADDHTQYALLAGRTGGQVITGGTASGNNTTIRSTSNATKGSVIFDETAATSSSSTGAVLVSGGIGISNTTDATSVTNGGTITTAGGLAVAKKAFVGTDLSVGGNLTVTGTASLPHSGFTGLAADDHAQYTLNLGRAGGQVITGGTASGNNTTIRSTSNATKGSVIFDETTTTTSSSTGAVRIAGGIGISNTTDAVSATNGGTITTAGGLAVAKKAFVGTDLSVGGNLTVTGTASLPHSGFTGLAADDHTQYALLAGRTGGQVITGGTGSGNNTTIRSTSNAAKGSVILDETTATSSSSSGALLVSGGIGISNSTDAVSATNGGTITTAGGLAVAKKAFVGTDLSVGGNFSVSGIATVPAPNPSNNGEIVNIGYLNSVGSTLPPKIYDDMALVTDLSEPIQAKWKGGSIYSAGIDSEITKQLKLAKISSNIINPGNSAIPFGYRPVIDSSHFELTYSRTSYLIKVPGRYYVSGTLITGIDVFSNSTTASYSIQLTGVVSGITTVRPGSEIFTCHTTSTTLGTDTISFGCCIDIPIGGAFFNIRSGRTAGASTVSLRNGSTVSVNYLGDSSYLDVYNSSFIVLNNATYVDIPMTNTYYADSLYNFTDGNAQVGVTTTGTYLVSAKVTFQRPTVTGSNPVGRFRIVNESGTPISDTFTGSVYNTYNGAVNVSNSTATWIGLIDITGTTGSIKIQAIIDSGSGALQANASICLVSVDTTTFPSQLNFRAVSTSNQLLSTTVFNIPWQSTVINTGGISFSPGTTSITVTKSSLYYISGIIPINVPLAQTNILITVTLLVSYDSGSTFRNITTAPIVKLAADNMSVPFSFFANLFSGARIRVTINSSGSVADLVTLETNCSLSILSFDDLVAPVDLFPIRGSFYRCCENSEFFTLPTTSITLTSQIWSKYVPAGIYRVSFNTSVGISTSPTVVTYTLNQSAENRGDNQVYTRGGTYPTGEFPIGFTRVITFDKGINYIFVSITTNRTNSVTITASLLEIERVI